MASRLREKATSSLGGIGGRAGATAPDDEEEDLWAPSPWPRRLVVAAIFLVAEIAMVRRTPGQLSHRLLGNLGDPALNIWTMRWDGHALLHSALRHPLSIFNANIYFPAPHTLAYADDLLSVAPFYNALYALTHNWTLSLNLLWLGELGLNMGATYSLTRWLTRRTEAAVFAGLASGFSAFMWSQTGHPQLQVIGLVPLGMLLLFKLLERPTMARAVGLGVVNIAILLAAQYWAAMYAIAVLVILVGWLIGARRSIRAPMVRNLLVALAVVGAITLVAAPTFVPYHDVQQVQGKRPLSPEWSLRPRDVVRATPGSYLYLSLAADTSTGSGERHLFPGFLTMALAAAGSAALALSYRRGGKSWLADGQPALAGERAPPDRRLFLVLLLVVALIALVMALGASSHGFWTPWHFLYDHVPGFAGIRVTARLAEVTVLIGAIMAGVGLDAILSRFRRPQLRIAITTVACIVVLAELGGPLEWTTLPSDGATLAVYHALGHRPAGVVVELPMTDPFTDVVRWSYTEPPRMVWSSIDWHPRLNGYSGYEPADYSDDARVIATLPLPAAQARLAQRHVRYLIVHVGFQAGYQMLTEAQATFLLDSLQPGATWARFGPNYLVDLGPPAPAAH